MKLKTHKRRKRLCPVLRRVAANLIRIGMLWTAWMFLAILSGMSPARYAGWVLAGLALMTTGYVLRRVVKNMEKHGMFLRRITKKSACKRQQP